ncbi:hypothetical protein [Undibacterium sp. KW1]|uniref:hypothetical protein n=1 Tax=Undibacterium sp. KW1 TaxID=2058624 RepID=UPI001E335BE7|nr:hypothetical protein [Undibacterium sp. KW1]
MSASHLKFLQNIEEVKTPNIHSRTDSATETKVEHGISLQQTVGTACALEYLRAHGVPRQVTQRVLTQPEHRRSCA